MGRRRERASRWCRRDPATSTPPTKLQGRRLFVAADLDEFDLKTGERMQTIGLWLGGFALLLLIGLLWGQRRAAKATLAHSRDMDARRRRRREATAARAEEPPAS